jgi:trehalose 6-phosphate phosphatase
VPLDEVVDCAEALATGLPGVRVERKPNAVALHYRQAPEHAPACRQALRRVLARHPALKLMEGKMVLEVLPRDIGKGHAIEAFLAEPPFAGRRPVFVGDDVTDEAGFEAVLRLGGVAIKVGPGSSLAEQRLDSAAAVRRWLLAQAEALST